MQVREGSDTVSLVFGGHEIDQVVSFASASRVMAPLWLSGCHVTVRGRPKSRDGLRSPRHVTWKGTISWAASWGYVRTVGLRRAKTEAVLSVGGANAIIEHVALDEMAFNTRLATAHSLRSKLVRGIMLGDLERSLIDAELSDQPHALLAGLHAAARKISSKPGGHGLHSLRMVATRLKRVPDLVRGTDSAQQSQAREILGRFLDLATNGADSILQMYVCEALPYFTELLADGTALLQRQAEELLRTCRNAHDTNVRLAATIASVRTSRDVPGLLENLLSLLLDSEATNSPYLEYVRETCRVLVGQQAGPSPTDPAVRHLCTQIETVRNSTALEGLLAEADRTGLTNQQKGEYFAEFVFVVLKLSGLFSLVTRKVHKGTDLEYDVIATFAREVGWLPKGFPLVVECKNLSGRADKAAFDQLHAACESRQSRYGKRAGVLATRHDATTSAKHLAELAAIRDEGMYAILGEAELRHCAKDRSYFGTWLSGQLEE